MSNKTQKTSSVKVNCPTCKNEVQWNDESEYRPFCSDRCQKIDLGAWANEEFSIAAEPTEEWSGDNTFSAEPSEHTLQ
ncbi:MAG: endogenous inhibitor of DNA gyrase (YacG/DUF329 family) [Pseudohongiellaceae bacterium]|jgi:endogenous inhibitor of DNA gyrase (YacG/DUF329 family)